MTHREKESSEEEIVVTEGVRRTPGVTTIGKHVTVPDPEVPEKKPRRRFTAQYKLRILEEADACTETGGLGALLRREGLYSSNLTVWRRQRDEGQLRALGPKKRGRKPKQKNSMAERVARLERENRRLENQLKQARTIIEVQKKVSEILGIAQPDLDDDGSST